MSDKMECPGCGSYTSSVLHAFDHGEPCPVCQLSHEAAAELFDKRQTVAVSRANEQVKAIADDALKRLGRAEADLQRLRRFADAVHEASQQLYGDPR